jgi:hypothetical protein
MADVSVDMGVSRSYRAVMDGGGRTCVTLTRLLAETQDVARGGGEGSSHNRSRIAG